MSLSGSDLSSDAVLVKWALGSLSVVLLGGVVAFAVMGSIAFSKIEKGAGKSFGLLFQRGNFLRVVTAIAVVQTVTVLTLMGRLNSEGAVGILGGVAGYVLGGLERQPPMDSRDKKPGGRNNVDSALDGTTD